MGEGEGGNRTYVNEVSLQMERIYTLGAGITQWLERRTRDQKLAD